MADPDVDHGFLINEHDDFLNYESPWLDFRHGGTEETVQEYVNRIAYIVAQDQELRLGVNGYYYTPLHPSIAALQTLLPPEVFVDLIIEDDDTISDGDPLGLIVDQAALDAAIIAGVPRPVHNRTQGQIVIDNILYYSMIVSFVAIHFI